MMHTRHFYAVLCVLGLSTPFGLRADADGAFPLFSPTRPPAAVHSEAFSVLFIDPAAQGPLRRIEHIVFQDHSLWAERDPSPRRCSFLASGRYRQLIELLSAEQAAASLQGAEFKGCLSEATLQHASLVIRHKGRSYVFHAGLVPPAIRAFVTAFDAAVASAGCSPPALSIAPLLQARAPLG